MHLVSHSVFLKILGWSLFNNLWQMALCWLLYRLFAGNGRRFSSATRYLMAVSLLAAGTAWFLVTFAAGLMDYSGSGIFSVLDMESMGASLLGANMSLPASVLVLATLPFLGAAYLVVLSIQIVRYAGYFRECNTYRRTGLLKAPARIRLFVDEVSRRMGISRKVEVWVSTLAESPMTIGFIKSVILLPLATLDQLSPLQMEAILLHELSHIRRSDYLMNLLLNLAGTLFFYNPFARMLLVDILKEMENSCDDEVLTFRYDAYTYVSALLSLEKSRQAIPFALSAGGKSSRFLLERVRRISGQQTKGGKRPGKWMMPLLLAAGSLLMILGLASRLPIRTEAAKSTPGPVAISRENQAPAFSIPLLKTQAARQNPLVAGNPPITSFRVRPAAPQLGLLTKVRLVDSSGDDPEIYQPASPIAELVLAEPAHAYSLEMPQTLPVAATPGATARLPYIPASSFSYQLTLDSPGVSQPIQLQIGRDGEKWIDQTVSDLQSANLEKIDKMIAENFRAINAEKIQVNLLQSITASGLDLLGSSSQNEHFPSGEEDRIFRDLKLQLQVLSEVKLSNQSQARKLSLDILKGQLKFHQENLKREMDLLETLQAIKKKIRTVYI